MRCLSLFLCLGFRLWHDHAWILFFVPSLILFFVPCLILFFVRCLYLSFWCHAWILVCAMQHTSSRMFHFSRAGIVKRSGTLSATRLCTVRVPPTTRTTGVGSARQENAQKLLFSKRLSQNHLHHHHQCARLVRNKECVSCTKGNSPNPPSLRFFNKA